MKRIAQLLVTLMLSNVFISPAGAWVDASHTVATLGSSSSVTITASAADASGNMYVTGYFTGTADFEPGPGSLSLTSRGLEDLFLMKLDSNGELLFAKTIGSSSQDRGNAVALDSSGNIYIGGKVSGETDFDPGVGYDSVTATNQDGFILKLSSSGEYLWNKKFDIALYATNVSAISIDSAGYPVVAGTFLGELTCDPANGVPNITAGTDYTDIFIVKLDSAGSYTWAKSFTGNAGGDYATKIAISSTNDVYVTGNFQGAIDFNPVTGVSTSTTSHGANEIFVVKLSSTGDFQWVKTIGGSLADHGTSISVDSSGNVVVLGDFKGVADFNVGAGVESVTSRGDYDVFALKLSAIGEYLWSRQFGGTGTEYNITGTVDSNGDILISGYFSGSVDFDPTSNSETKTTFGGTDIFISKINSDGSYGWNRTFGSTNNDSGRATVLLPNNKIFVSGNYRETVNFGTDTDVVSFSASGGDQFFLVLDVDGSSYIRIVTKSAGEIAREAQEARERAIGAAVAAIKSAIANGEKISAAQFAAADLRGVTNQNVDSINGEIQQLPDNLRGELATISKIVLKYETAGRIQDKGSVYYAELASAGLAAAESRNKTAIMRALRMMSATQLDSIEKIMEAVAEIEAKYAKRSAKLAATTARIRSKSPQR